MNGEAWLFIFAVLAAAALIFTSVFFIVSYSDLETDYINPIDLCNRLNAFVIPEHGLHAFLCLLFLLGFQWTCIVINAPLLAFNVNKCVTFSCASTQQPYRCLCICPSRFLASEWPSHARYRTACVTSPPGRSASSARTPYDTLCRHVVARLASHSFRIHRPSPAHPSLVRSRPSPAPTSLTPAVASTFRALALAPTLRALADARAPLRIITNNWAHDATEIFRTLGGHKKESFIKLAFYLMCFFYYLYRMIVALIKDDV
ncbi:cornichon-domain-containing protein [Exidia glandulosa HHB12029]|uniref:Cornichon-domain-containing protein n=1 Tax=Exidia glandulosa HHB12029 TaxID=1314781 RepID=A0A165MVC9_EXIGL|nr:cornichon-domain-containing protein [Exidia glandulosa HHB12029]